MARLPAISLFSGAMGLDIGLEQAGFDIRVAVENDPRAIETIKLNKPHLPVIAKDIREVSSEEVLEAAGLRQGEAALVAGGPCCQAFSLVGKRSSISDPRGTLFTHFLRLVRDIQPDFYLMENVKGLISAAIEHRPLNARTPDHAPLSNKEVQGSAFSMVLEGLRELGGITSVDLVNSVDHGAPQSRVRLIIIGSTKGLIPPRLRATTKKQKTLADALDGFHEALSTCAPISPRLASYLPLVPAGGNWRSLPKGMQKEAIGEGAYRSWGGRTGYLRRLAWDKPCPTLTCSPASRATMLIHPEENRVLSVGEYKQIQGFPTEWYFAGGVSSQYEQVGNAVPVILGESLGKHIKAALRKNHAESTKNNGSRVFTYNEKFYSRLTKMKTTTISPYVVEQFGRLKVNEWLSKADAGEHLSGMVELIGG